MMVSLEINSQLGVTKNLSHQDGNAINWKVSLIVDIIVSPNVIKMLIDIFFGLFRFLVHVSLNYLVKSETSGELCHVKVACSFSITTSLFGSIVSDQ